MQKQHLAIIILFVFTLLLGVASFLLPKEVVSPTPEHIQPTTQTTTDINTMEPIVPEAKVSTEGWKTCRNEEYGWEVKYPGEWYVYGKGSHGDEIYTDYMYETPCVGDNVVIAEWEPGTNRLDTSGKKSVQINTNQESFGTNRSGFTNVRDLAQSYAELAHVEFYSVGELEFVRIEINNGPTKLDAIQNLKRLEIKGLTEYPDLLETMLTTFRFLDTATSSPK